MNGSNDSLEQVLRKRELPRGLRHADRILAADYSYRIIKDRVVGTSSSARTHFLWQLVPHHV